jgi:predicted phosphodiesterase
MPPRYSRRIKIKWGKICLSWYTFACVFVLLYLYIVHFKFLNHLFFSKNIFVTFSDLLYELIFTNQGAYTLHSYIDLWMEYIKYVSFETLFQDLPLISIAYCSLYTKPFLTIGHNNKLSFFWETSGCRREESSGWTEFCLYSKKNKIHECCNVNYTTSSATSFLSPSVSKSTTSSTYFDHIGTYVLTTTHRSHIITLKPNLPPGDDYIYGMNMIDGKTNQRFKSSPAINGKKFRVPPSSKTMLNYDNMNRNADLQQQQPQKKEKNQLLYSFLIFGDNQAGAVTFERLLQSVNENERDLTPPNLIIHLGDAVQDAYIKREWHSYFFSPLQRLPFASQIPLLLTQGNHDVIPSPFFDFPTHNNGKKESADNTLNKNRYKHTYFSLSVGNAIRFVVLNSNIDDKGQDEFMLREFQSSEFQSASYRIVICHIAPFIEFWEPNAWFKKKEKDWGNYVRTKWVPIFEGYRVNVVISGHSHIYQRGRKNNIMYIISGGAGAMLEDINTHRVEDHKFYEVTIAKHHLLKLKVIGENNNDNNKKNIVVKNKKGLLLNGWIHNNNNEDGSSSSSAEQKNDNENETSNKMNKNTEKASLQLQFIAQDKEGVPIDTFTV